MTTTTTSIPHWVVKLAARALRAPGMDRVRQALARLYRQARLAAVTAPVPEIPEIGPLTPRPDPSPASRLNLLVPSVSKQHVFGGAQTALLVLDVLSKGFDSVRIITTDDSSADCLAGAYYATWPVVDLQTEPPAGNHIVTAGSRYGRTLAVGPNDHFVATAWWTAHNGFALLDWQQRTYPGLTNRRLIYLIQDFEPGFYPWSARHALAAATYCHPARTLALINSRFLADYFPTQGYTFPVSWVLEPRLNRELALARAAWDTFAKEPIVFVYGRPGVERNAFPLLIAALKRWVQNYPGAPDWQILAAGESFAPLDLGRGCKLRSMGKLEITEYATLLARTAVGVSLMISPHPSYPPLELAAFGARVITNRFANKDLQSVTSFITTVDPPSPDLLAQAIARKTQAFDALPATGRCIKRSGIDWNDGFLAAERWADGWPDQILHELGNLTALR